MNDQQIKELVSQFDAIEAQIKAQGMRHGDGIFAHITRLKDAILARDYLAITVAIRDLLTHFIGDEDGMRGTGTDMQAFPWETLLPLVLDLIRRWINR